MKNFNATSTTKFIPNKEMSTPSVYNQEQNKDTHSCHFYSTFIESLTKATCQGKEI